MRTNWFGMQLESLFLGPAGSIGGLNKSSDVSCIFYPWRQAFDFLASGASQKECGKSSYAIVRKQASIVGNRGLDISDPYFLIKLICHVHENIFQHYNPLYICISNSMPVQIESSIFKVFGVLVSNSRGKYKISPKVVKKRRELFTIFFLASFLLWPDKIKQADKKK